MAAAGMAADKKGARRKKATIAVEDETGFLLQPIRRRTWGPRGQTPIQKAWDRRDRLSALGAITVSPQRRRLNLYFRLQPRNVEGADAVSFVEQLHRRVPGPLVVVWDRSGPHKAAAKQLLPRHSAWLSIEWFPPYSPKLNPQEHCWTQTKYHDLADFLPDDVDELYRAAGESLNQQSSNPSLLQSHFEWAKLKL
jgi:transposase